MALAKIMPLTDIVHILPRGGYHLFLLRQVQGKSHLYRWSPTKSFSASSSMVVSWQPTTFLLLVGPRWAAAIQGFSKATLLTEAVTVSLGVTLVASKFSLPIEAVTVNTHPLSSSAWLDGVSWLASSTTNLVVGTTWVSTSVGLVAKLVSRSFGVSVSDSVESTMASSPSGVSAGPGRVSLTSTLAGKVVGSAGGVSSLGGHLDDEGVVLCAPWASVELGSVSPTSVVVSGVKGSLWGSPCPSLQLQG